MRSLGSLLAVFGLGLLLAACSGGSDDEPTYVEQPVEELYNAGMDALLAGDYQAAATNFDEVERQHPYSSWSAQAQLMAAYAHYQANRYDEAIVTVERFIELHPGHKDIAYAYYLRAISYYEQITDVGRDQKVTQLALLALDEVVRRFPGTDYARDARLKSDLALDHLAGKQMEIGRFYQGQSECLAAINRYRVVVEEFQTTTHVPEALHRLVECYLTVGITREAQAAAAVLGYNFPGSEWYQDSYALLNRENLEPEADEDSWLSSLW